jgi:hypothetical protein
MPKNVMPPIATPLPTSLKNSVNLIDLGELNHSRTTTPPPPSHPTITLYILSLLYLPPPSNTPTINCLTHINTHQTI